LVALPPFAAEPVPESAEARAERLESFAPMLWAAAKVRPAGVSRPAWTGVLIELTNAETALALYIWKDECETGPYKCDDGKAKGPFQAWEVACPELWTLPGGSQEWLAYSAQCASRLLTSAYYRCRHRNDDPLAGAFSGYAGASCVAPWAYARAERARGFAGRLGG